MKKLVLLFAVAMAVSMTSCVCGPQENSKKDSVSTGSVSAVVDENQPSAPAVSETPKEEVKDATSVAPEEEKKAEETKPEA